jgi:hypothetical protein
MRDLDEMSNEEFRALLDLMMVSDPWPLNVPEYEALEGLFARESDARGFASWIVAYHELEPLSL